MMSSFRRMLPAIPHGYAIAPQSSWFSVLLPIARVNEVTNPSGELATTTGYTAGAGALTTTAAQQYHGVRSFQYTPSAAVNDGFYYTLTTTNALRAISCKFLGVAGVPYTLSLASTAPADLVAYPFRATGRWQWIWLYHNETGATTRRIYVKKNNSASVGAYYVDGVQSEIIQPGEFVSTYIDGDQAGLVPNQFPAAYLWTGTPHGSASTRSGQTRAGGMVMRLDYYGFVLLAMIGLGLPTPNNVSVPYVLLDGAQYERTQKPPRQFTLAGRWDSASFPQLQRQISQLGAALDRDKVAQQQPIVMQYQALDSCNAPTSDVARIVCSYQGGLEGVTDNLHAEQVSMVFKQWLPLMQGDGESGGTLAAQLSVANANNIIVRSASGVWSALGTGGNGTVKALAADSAGNLYAGGDFTSMGGVANTKNIAMWNGSAWVAMGTGVTTGSGVTSIAVGPDGSVYVGGTFTVMGGVANTVRIAKWSGGAWSALSTGADNEVDALAFGTDGTLYATGFFLNVGGVAANRVASWNGAAWTALSTGLNNPGNALAVAPDGSLYVGGVFTTAGGVGANYIAKWSAGAWSALGVGMNINVDSLAIGVNGVLYAGGEFTTAGGLAIIGIAQWNGVNWASMGTLGQPVYALSRVPTTGQIYAGGGFTFINGIPLPDAMAQWNGATWTALDVDLPGTAGIRALLARADGSLVVGFTTTGTAVAASTTTITNPGTNRSYPTVVIKGPSAATSRIYQIVNTTANRAIYFNLTINAGETVTMTLTPDNLSFISDFRGDISSTIMGGSQEADFFLQPGANTISFLAADNTVATTLRFRPLYDSVADLTP